MAFVGRAGRLGRVSGALVLALAATGCADGAGGQFGQTITQGLASIDRGIGSLFSDSYLDETDACFAERKALAENGAAFDPAYVRNAALGAAAGGLAVALAGGSTRDVVIGVGVGAAAGLAGTYLAKLKQDGLDANGVATRARSDVAAENAQIDKAIAAFNRLDQCRAREARSVQTAFNRRLIDRPTAETQMAAVRARRAEDVEKFREIARRIDGNSQAYVAVYNDIAADNNRGGLQLQQPQPNRRTPSATQTQTVAQKEAGTAPGSLSGASGRNLDRLQRECLTNVQKRDAAFTRVAQAERQDDAFNLDA